MARERLGGTARLAHKPLPNMMPHAAFAEAARQEVPVQFHVGYGDSGVDLRFGDPPHLRAVPKRPSFRGMTVVLHLRCPCEREGWYLAAVIDVLRGDAELLYNLGGPGH